MNKFCSQDKDGTIFLNGVKTVYSHWLPRGKAVAMDQPPKSHPPRFPWEREVDYIFTPTVVMNAEDYLDFCLITHCWDAALDCAKSMLRYKIRKPAEPAVIHYTVARFYPTLGINVREPGQLTMIRK